MSNKSKHPNSILGLDAKSVSKKLVELRFDYMADLFGHFHDFLREVTQDEKSKGRDKLALELQLICSHINAVTEALDRAWEMSKNKIEDEDFDLFEDIIENKDIVSPE